MAQHVIDTLRQQGWLYEAPTQTSVLAFPTRYQSVPMELKNFVSAFHSLRNRNDTMWFLSSANYNEANTNGFNWNEFELMSLTAAAEDKEWTKNILSFWSQHLPVFMSVQGHYCYAACCVEGFNSGKYVFGEEPEFEEPTVIASSIGQAIEWLTSKGLLNDTNI